MERRSVSMQYRKSIRRAARPLRLAEFIPPYIVDGGELQTLIPKLAKDRKSLNAIEETVHQIPTTHRLYLQDSRDMNSLPDESVHLVVTSPPYWTLKQYPKRKGQLGLIDDFNAFITELDKVWTHCYRVLVPGGRLIVVVGDVCLSRRNYGRHVVLPLHAGIQEHCREIGFDNLAPILWYKIANVQLEVENGSRFLGKPYEPNAIIKNDIEYILMQRKPGGYRKPSPSARILSVIPEDKHRIWFQQIWRLPGASTRQHPAPFPIEISERLVRMFSFVGDTVIDPFLGTGTTSYACALWGRNSIGFEIEPLYLRLAEERLGKLRARLFSKTTIEIIE